ncbi:hypothetical protein cyc_08225 [Cyclospora cayetanensis]|uniref:Uncharacterized protein n=1 Tax=Cyclospora cayetanensis TaxID=88456 RepID=A0A1D3CR15_9EIME|nr:hypothetical protein cyc_08225 [Cyclospora cayetanensis]
MRPAEGGPPVGRWFFWRLRLAVECEVLQDLALKGSCVGGGENNPPAAEEACVSGGAAKGPPVQCIVRASVGCREKGAAGCSFPPQHQSSGVSSGCVGGPLAGGAPPCAVGEAFGRGSGVVGSRTSVPCTSRHGSWCEKPPWGGGRLQRLEAACSEDSAAASPGAQRSSGIACHGSEALDVSKAACVSRGVVGGFAIPQRLTPCQRLVFFGGAVQRSCGEEARFWICLSEGVSRKAGREGRGLSLSGTGRDCAAAAAAGEGRRLPSPRLALAAAAEALREVVSASAAAAAAASEQEGPPSLSKLRRSDSSGSPEVHRTLQRYASTHISFSCSLLDIGKPLKLERTKGSACG